MAAVDNIIIYPTPLFNSFISLEDALALADNYIIGSFFTSLSSADDQVRYLMHAFRVISLLPGFTMPDETVPEDVTCLKEVQLQIVLHDLRYGLSSSTDKSDNQIRKETVGPITTEYFEDLQATTPSDVPVECFRCLALYGYTPISISGLASIRKTR